MILFTEGASLVPGRVPGAGGACSWEGVPGPGGGLVWGVSRPTAKVEVEGDLVQAHSQGGN